MSTREPKPDPSFRLSERDGRVDAALRRAFADLDAPARIDLSDSARVPRAKPRIPIGLGLAAVAAFVVCALLPSALVRWDAAARVWEAVAPWALRCAPALGLLSWAWLERSPARRVDRAAPG